MRKYISLFFSAIVVLCACNAHTPDGVLEKDKMVNLLVDVHIADGTMFNISSQADSVYKYGTDKYLTVFRNHHTDSVQFNKSIKYYSSEPEMLTVMYDSVGKILQRKTDSVNKVMVKEQARKAKLNPSKMMRGMGMMPDTTKQKLKADSIKGKKRLDSIKARMKFKADSIRKKQKQDSLRSKKRIKGTRVKA